MGVYLSQPVVEKFSSDDHNDRLSYGVSSMQGWRSEQEDAHTCILDYDENTSFFAVFDGHGGYKVAKYSSTELHKFLKGVKKYAKGDIKGSLEQAFVGFDRSLLNQDVIEQMESIRARDSSSISELSKQDLNELLQLKQDAQMPLESVIAQYERDCSRLYSSSDGQSSVDQENDDKPSHSYDKTHSDTDKSFEASASTSNYRNNFEPCTSSSISNREICNSSSVNFSQDLDSVSSSLSDPIEDKNDICKVSSTKCLDTKSDVSCLNETESRSSNENCNSEQINDENFSNNNESHVSTSSEAATSIGNHSTSDCCSAGGDEPSSSSKYKIKHKKSIEDEVPDVSQYSDRPIFQAFLKNLTNPEDGSDNGDLMDDSSESGQEEDPEDGEEWSDTESEADEDESEDDINEYKKYSDEGTSWSLKCPAYVCGCTAVVAIVRNDQLYVANAGDSRCVLSRKGVAIDMSVDHKPEDFHEKSRIMNAGGRISDGRVNGGLNLSRAIGDHTYKANKDLCLKKQMITAFPDVKSIQINPDEDEFMVLACDGIWNSFSSQDVVTFVRNRLHVKDKISEICEELFNKCLAPNTTGDGAGCDNMTCIIVKFCNISRTEDGYKLVNENEKCSSDIDPDMESDEADEEAIDSSNKNGKSKLEALSEPQSKRSKLE